MVTIMKGEEMFVHYTKDGVPVVIIDYLDIFYFERNYNREEQSKIWNKLKTIANKCNAKVITLESIIDKKEK